MIQINIRVYDGKQMHYCTLDTYHILVKSLRNEVDLAECDKMLAINKHDCNNHLIYIGDIVKFPNSRLNNMNKYIVAIDEILQEIVLCNADGTLVFRHVKWNQVEVVGNKFENIHLMED